MWTETDCALERRFEFVDFATALAFVNKVGELAERMGHHPDISILNYKYVVISTTTHDEGLKVTRKDRELAKAIDTLL